MPDPDVHPSRTDRPPPVPLSALAVTALVLALIPMCPPSNMLAVGLGLMAVRRIVAARGRLRGLGVARAAVFAGLVLTLLSCLLWSRVAEGYQRRNHDSMISHIEETIRAMADGRITDVTADWVDPDGTAPEDEEIERFGAALRTRYGQLQRVVIISESYEGLVNKKAQVALMYHFETADLTGSVDLDLVLQSGEFMPAYRTRLILIEDPDLGDLQLPGEEAP